MLNALKSLDVWQEEEEHMVVPCRSTLYSPEPKGIGTSEVEGLASYLTRVAQAHNVHAGTLFSQGLAPELLKRCELARGAERRLLASLLVTINGSGKWAERIAMVLGEMTARSELNHLTLWPLAGMLPSADRQTWHVDRLWCPKCLTESWRCGEDFHDPLAWSVRSVTMCVAHERPLRRCCPQCDHRQKRVPMMTGLCHCGECGAWLGDEKEDVRSDLDLPVPIKAWSWQMWTARQIGDALAFVSTLAVANYPTTSTLTVGLRRCFDALGPGSICALARAMGINSSNISAWLVADHRPSIERALQICAKLNLSLRDLYAGAPDVSRVELVSASPAVPVWSQPALRKGVRKLAPQKSQIKQALKAALKSPEPVSLEHVARQLHCCRATMRNRYPELCDAVVMRRRTHLTARCRERCEQEGQQVRELVIKMHDEGAFPMVADLMERLGINHLFPASYQVRRQTLHGLGYPMPRPRARYVPRNGGQTSLPRAAKPSEN